MWLLLKRIFYEFDCFSTVSFSEFSVWVSGEFGGPRHRVPRQPVAPQMRAHARRLRLQRLKAHATRAACAARCRLCPLTPKVADAGSRERWLCVR